MGKYTPPLDKATNVNHSAASNRFPLRLLVAALIIIILACGMGIGSYIRASNHKKVGTACSTKSTEPFLKELTSPIVKANYDKAAQTAAKIQKLSSYEQDANCVYALTAYYINLSDSVNSRQNLTKLEKVYDQHKKFSPALGKIIPIETLKANVVFLEQQLEKGKKSGPPIPGTNS